MMFSQDAFQLEQRKCWYTDRLPTDASAPVAPNRVHFLFQGEEEALDRQQACRSKNDATIVKSNDGVEAEQ